MMVILFLLSKLLSKVSCCNLSEKDNKKLSKISSKGFERSVYWNKYKTKIENKNMTNKLDIFSNQILLESVDYLF